MATTNTIELPIRAILDDEDRRRIRGVANALTKASGAVAELAEAFAALADGGRVLDDPPPVNKGRVFAVGEGVVPAYGVDPPLTGERIRLVRAAKPIGLKWAIPEGATGRIAECDLTGSGEANVRFDREWNEDKEWWMALEDLETVRGNR